MEIKANFDENIQTIRELKASANECSKLIDLEKNLVVNAINTLTECPEFLKLKPTIFNIVKLTGLNNEKVREALEALIDKGFVEFEYGNPTTFKLNKIGIKNDQRWIEV